MRTNCSDQEQRAKPDILTHSDSRLMLLKNNKKGTKDLQNKRKHTKNVMNIKTGIMLERTEEVCCEEH